jgi:hypothetical protein
LSATDTLAQRRSELICHALAMPQHQNHHGDFLIVALNALLNAIAALAETRLLKAMLVRFRV